MRLSEMARPRGARRIEEAGGYRLLFDAGQFVLERDEAGGWREVERGGWLPHVLGIAFGDGVRVDGPAAVALPWSARCLDFDARWYGGAARPPEWREPGEVRTVQTVRSRITGK